MLLCRRTGIAFPWSQRGSGSGSGAGGDNRITGSIVSEDNAGAEVVAQ
jgi:hypothetical protein